MVQVILLFIIHGFKIIYNGIGRKNNLQDQTMDNKLMYIPNDEKQSYMFCECKLLVVKFNMEKNLDIYRFILSDLTIIF